MSNFHVSLPCSNIETTKKFYTQELGFSLGREAHNWIDVNIFGNQITFAQRPDSVISTNYYSLDSKRLPIFHLGIILSHEEWYTELEKFEDKPYLELEPAVFLLDNVGEHDSFFIKDPNGYCLEFKTFKSSTEIFKQKTNKYSD